jgi:hypothetical protein
MSELLSKKIKVAGRAIIVHKASFVMSLQRSVLISNATTEKPNGEYKNLDPSIVTYVHQLLYPSLVACSEGKLPTEAEFLKLSEEDVQRWLDTASEKNPDWFRLESESAKVKEEKEKNASKPY